MHHRDASTTAAPSAKRAKVDKELDAAQPEQADNMDVDAPIRQQEQQEQQQQQQQQQQQHAEDDRAAANYVVSLEPLIISPRV